MDDIVSVEPSAGFVVVGWFTEDDVSRPLAETLADDLYRHRAPFHLYSLPRDGWDTRPKPSVALTAIQSYPGKTVVLMDVDCRVCGDLAPLADLPGDVGLHMRVRPNKRMGKVKPRQVVVTASSRVVVLRPFGGALSFLKEWQRLCAVAAQGGDEAPMVWAYLNCPWVVYHLISPRYAAQGSPGTVPGAIIEHGSAHDRTAETRWLRTGRTGRGTRSLWSAGRGEV